MKIVMYIALTLIGIVVLVMALGMYKFNHLASQPGYDVDGNQLDINNFEECVEAGFSVMESHPEQCSNGEQTFVKGGGIIAEPDFGPIPVETDGGIGDGAQPLGELINPQSQLDAQIETSLDLDFLGLSVTDAEHLANQHNIPFRVVQRDGELLPTTRDLRPGRINAVINDDVVTAYDVEGA